MQMNVLKLHDDEVSKVDEVEVYDESDSYDGVVVFDGDDQNI